MTLPGASESPEFRLAMSESGEEAVLFRQKDWRELERLPWASGWQSLVTSVPSRTISDAWMSPDGRLDWISFVSDGPISAATFARDRASLLTLGPVHQGMLAVSSFPEFQASGIPKKVLFSASGERSAILTDQGEFLSSDGGHWRRSNWVGSTLGPFDVTSDRLSLLVTLPSGGIIERVWADDTWKDEAVADPIHLNQAWPTPQAFALTSHPEIAFATWTATIAGQPLAYFGRKDEFGKWRIQSSLAVPPQAQHTQHRLAVSSDGSLALTSYAICGSQECPRDQLALVSWKDGSSNLDRIPLSAGCEAGAVALAARTRRGYFAIRCDQVIHLGVWDGETWQVNEVRPTSELTYNPDVVTNSDGSRALFVWAEGIGLSHVHSSLLFSAD